MWRCFIAILQKEVRHLLRDPLTLLFVFLMPVMLVTLFGYTIKNEINNANIGILNHAQGTHSKDLVSGLTASGYFTVVEYLNKENEIESFFQRGAGSMVMVIPVDFEENLVRNKQGKIQLVVDASDLNVSATLVSYANEVIARFQKNLSANVQVQPVDIRLKMQYNPLLESAYMFIPGNIALIMILITSLMASITLSKERETGSWRMLAITPANQFVIVLGKIIPYMVLSLICTAMVIVLGIVIFNMPMHGSVALLLLLCFLFMFTACSLGVLISVFTSTQQVAMLICMIGFFMPALLLSDFIFPVENMPVVLQLLSHIVPAKWFIIAMRDIMIKGAGLELLWMPVTILTGLNIILLALSIKRLSKRIV